MLTKISLLDIFRFVMINAERIEMRKGTTLEAHAEIVSWVVNGFANIVLGKENYLTSKTKPENPIKSVWTEKEYEDSPLGRLIMHAEDINYTLSIRGEKEESKRAMLDLILMDPASSARGYISGVVWELEQKRDFIYETAQTISPLKLPDVIFENS